MRLIDADAYKKDFEVADDTDESVREKYEKISEILCHLIDEQPTVDAQPVVRGKWENVNPVEVPLYRCSVCGHTPTTIKTNFCADCGARME